jgi:hypothetical protein
MVEADIDFITFGDLLGQSKVSLAELVCSVEKVACYKIDQFGRIGKVTADEGVAQLTFISQYMSPADDEEAHYLEQHLTDEESPMQHFGWLTSAIPDFKENYRSWLTKQAPESIAPDPVTGDVWRLLLAMTREIVGDSSMLNLQKQRSTTISELSRKLQQNGDFFDEDTLRKYIKSNNPKFRDYIDRIHL